MTTQRVAYAAIRQCRDTGVAWIDLETVDCLQEGATAKAVKLNTLIPSWAAANEFVYTARIRVIAEPE